MRASADLPPMPIDPAILDRSIARGLSFLREHQYPNGEFCAYAGSDPALESGGPDSVVFPTALIAGSLLALAGDSVADEIVDRATKFFRAQMNRGGVWNHFTGQHPYRQLCPLDVDDTCCISSILRARGVSWLPDNVPLLLSNRDARGLFYSWFLLRARWNPLPVYWRIVLPELLRPMRSFLFWHHVEASRGDVDAVVNANALHYLGDIPETRPIVDFILRVIAETRETSSDLWYRDPQIVYYFFSRNLHRGVTALEPARKPMIDRLIALARPDGRLGESAVETALAACALLNLQARPPELARAMQYLIDAQESAGSWPRWIIYWGGPKRRLGWGSEEISTGFCLEALARYRKPVLPGGACSAPSMR